MHGRQVKEEKLTLPRNIDHIRIPPVKIQGIKSKIVPFIASNIDWDGCGTYYEPFMGSGVVGFNIAPEKAVFSDINPHLINFYRSIQSGEITSSKVRGYLESEAPKLAATPADKNSYYYTVRDRFNSNGSPLDFIFLQRSNFNGMMRFNKHGQYNVPFCRKPERFRPALITKIVNQVAWVEDLIHSHPHWSFSVMDFEEVFSETRRGDFLYLDPPYIDRHDEYFSAWSHDSAVKLASCAQQSEAGFALSMWLKNKYRYNDHISLWDFGVLCTTEHFYHIGAKESNRNAMTEALVISPHNVAYKQGVLGEEDSSLFPIVV